MVVAVVLLTAAVVGLVALLALEYRRRAEISDQLARVQAQERATEDVGPRVDEPIASALAAITQGVVVADRSGTTIYENPFAAAFLQGRHGDAVVGHTIERLLGDALVGSFSEEEVQLFGPPRRTVLLHCQPITDARGAVHGAVVLIDDITEQERLDAMRRDFVANISHELRTPVGAMSLLAETLLGETDADVIEPLANRILTEATRMGRTIEDLLELSRIEHGVDLDREGVVIQAVIAEAMDAVAEAAEQREIQVGVVQPDEALLVLGDRRQLRTAIYNLLDNAVKYADQGQGIVSVRARRRDEVVEIEVQDNGIGIPRRDLDRIFERFYRVDRGRSRASGGTGLGLSIVRHVVVNHGGRISVDSVEGEGSSFRLELPGVAGQAGPSTAHPNEVRT
jgi:two-component system sensor histidine kinase SenX3